MHKRQLYLWAKSLNLAFRHHVILKELIHLTDDCTFEVWATVEKLAEESRSSERRVQYALSDFRNDGLIIDTNRHHRTRRGGRVPIYRVAPDLVISSSSEGAEAAPRLHALHPRDRSFVHPQNRTLENKISKETWLDLATNRLPEELNLDFRHRYGDKKFTSVLCDADWDLTERAIICWSGQAAKKLRDECSSFLRDWKASSQTRRKGASHG